MNNPLPANHETPGTHTCICTNRQADNAAQQQLLHQMMMCMLLRCVLVPAVIPGTCIAFVTSIPTQPAQRTTNTTNNKHTWVWQTMFGCCTTSSCFSLPFKPEPETYTALTTCRTAAGNQNSQNSCNTPAHEQAFGTSVSQLNSGSLDSGKTAQLCAELSVHPTPHLGASHSYVPVVHSTHTHKQTHTVGF